MTQPALTLPCLGLVQTPSPLESHTHPSLAQLWLKRDDLLQGLTSGNKARKLDYLLAQEPYRSATVLESLGAIGSGHLVATGTFAQHLGKRLIAHCFFAPPKPYVLHNLKSIASTAHAVHFYRSRTTLALTQPGLLLSQRRGGAVVIPPGGSTPTGVAGFVAAGLELAQQLTELPDRLYVALGSGGTTAGLAIGLAMAGKSIPIVAVSAVERTLAPPRRLFKLIAQTRRYLVQQGVVTPEVGSIQIDYSQVGPGYARASQASVDACKAFPHLALEPLYSGKAMAALLRDAHAGRTRTPLFWVTAHNHAPAPIENWHHKLPGSLRRRLLALC